MKIKSFKPKFTKIKSCAKELFESQYQQVEFIFEYLNNGFRKTYAYQELSLDRLEEYKYLASNIDHIWENL